MKDDIHVLMAFCQECQCYGPAEIAVDRQKVIRVTCFYGCPLPLTLGFKLLKKQPATKRSFINKNEAKIFTHSPL